MKGHILNKLILIMIIILFVPQFASANEIKIKIRKCLIENIYKHKQILSWDIQKLNAATEVLYVAKKYYKVKINDIFATISLESYFNPYAVGKNKTSIDYGLTQQNSKYIYTRYSVAKKVLDKYNIKYNKKDTFDIALNLMSCVLFKYTIKKLCNRRKNKLYSKNIEQIVAYNLGIRGARMKNRIKTGYRYYRIYRKRMKFCSVI
jgi:hypothetical protein